MAQRRVVVTGFGSLTPLGNDTASLWSSLINGVSGAKEISRFDASKFKTRFACEIEGFNPEDHFPRKDIRKLDLFQQFALVAAEEAVKASGLDIDHIDNDRCGVIWASGVGGVDTLDKEFEEYLKGDGIPRFTPYFINKTLIDSAAGMIAAKYHFGGPSFAIVSACSSSSNSIIEACRCIKLNEGDLFVVGGSEAPITASGIGSFNAMHALSVRNDDMLTASRPFDKDRDGFVVGEGAGAMVVEELDHALQRGAHIFAEIAGYGQTNDNHHITAPTQTGIAAQKAMKLALQSANLRLTDVDHINTHGTSTPIGDASELNGILNLFGDAVDNILLTSTKSMTGHLLGAAGVVESIIAIKSMLEGIVPPTINHFTDDPTLSPKLKIVFNKHVKHNIDVVMNNSFGFGGHNTSIVFKKYE